MTPRPTPDCETSTTTTVPVTDQNNQRGPRGPRTEGIDPANIIDSSRVRKSRKEAHLAGVQQTDQASGFHSAFQAGTQHHQSTRRLHRTNLPPVPRNWKDLEKHQFGLEFKAAAQKEYSNLDRRGNFWTVTIPKGHFVIPTMWVFTYKFDKDGYVTKFKARLVVRRDLQPSTDQDSYAATLAARSFRCLIAIAAQFNLIMHQLDAVNAFTNSHLDETVYIRFPDSFENPGFCILLLLALYGLRRSALLWFTEFTTTLLKLGLQQVLEAECLYINSKLIVFFYVDDIAILSRTSDIDAYEAFQALLFQHTRCMTLGNSSGF
jgi:hypothetical protein